MKLSKIEQILFDITLEWNELEDTMGENAALEVACQQHGKSSQWYYDKMMDYHKNVNLELRKYYDKKH